MIINCFKKALEIFSSNFINIIYANFTRKFLKDFKLFHYTSCNAVSSSTLWKFETPSLHVQFSQFQDGMIFFFRQREAFHGYGGGESRISWEGREKASRYIILCVFYSEMEEQSKHKNFCPFQLCIALGIFPAIRSFSFLYFSPEIKFNSKKFLSSLSCIRLLLLYALQW